MEARQRDFLKRQIHDHLHPVDRLILRGLGSLDGSILSADEAFKCIAPSDFARKVVEVAKANDYTTYRAYSPDERYFDPSIVIIGDFSNLNTPVRNILAQTVEDRSTILIEGADSKGEEITRVLDPDFYLAGLLEGFKKRGVKVYGDDDPALSTANKQAYEQTDKIRKHILESAPGKDITDLLKELNRYSCEASKALLRRNDERFLPAMITCSKGGNRTYQVVGTAHVITFDYNSLEQQERSYIAIVPAVVPPLPVGPHMKG